METLRGCVGVARWALQYVSMSEPPACKYLYFVGQPDAIIDGQSQAAQRTYLGCSTCLCAFSSRAAAAPRGRRGGAPAPRRPAPRACAPRTHKSSKFDCGTAHTLYCVLGAHAKVVVARVAVALLLANTGRAWSPAIVDCGASSARWPHRDVLYRHGQSEISFAEEDHKHTNAHGSM